MSHEQGDDLVTKEAPSWCTDQGEQAQRRPGTSGFATLRRSGDDVQANLVVVVGHTQASVDLVRGRGLGVDEFPNVVPDAVPGQGGCIMLAPGM